MDVTRSTMVDRALPVGTVPGFASEPIVNASKIKPGDESTNIAGNFPLYT